MDITSLFKACIKTAKLQNKGLSYPPERNKSAKTTHKDEFMERCKLIKNQITQLRDFLVENRAAYMQYACHLKKFRQMSNEERDIIDREAEKIINICTQHVCELKLEYGALKTLTAQQRNHTTSILELLANYLKAVYNIFNDQKNFRISRDLETYKFLKLDADHKHDSMDYIEYKEKINLDKVDKEETEGDSVPLLNDENSNENGLRRRHPKKENSKKELGNQTIEDDERTEETGLSPEDLQMLEIENKQLMSVFKGLTEEVQQIEKHVYDIAKLQEIFDEKISEQRNDIERIANTVVGSTENVKEANEQIREATQRNAGLRVYILFFLIVMSFSLLFLDWYND